MSAFLSKLAGLVPVYEQAATITRSNCGTAHADRDGASSDMLGRTVRDLGIAAYVLRGDVAEFRKDLRESADIRLQLFRRRIDGEPISESFLTMLSYKHLFDALAAGDCQLCISLAKVMGGRESSEIDHDHPFDRALGYCLRAVILENSAELAEWMPRFMQECGDSRYVGFRDIFMGINADSVETVSNGLLDVLKEHQQQSSRGGLFNGTPDELLCVWGIGSANLARSRGLDVRGVSPLIPNELLITRQGDSGSARV